MSFVTLLAVAFIVLKLMKVITWSWLWVLSPLWAGLVFFLLVALLFGGAAALAS